MLAMQALFTDRARAPRRRLPTSRRSPTTTTHSPTRRRRSSSTRPLHNFRNTQYFGNIGHWHGRSPLPVIFDTGSANLWVPHRLLLRGGCLAHPRSTARKWAPSARAGRRCGSSWHGRISARRSASRCRRTRCASTTSSSATRPLQVSDERNCPCSSRPSFAGIVGLCLPSIAAAGTSRLPLSRHDHAHPAPPPRQRLLLLPLARRRRAPPTRRRRWCRDFGGVSEKLIASPVHGAAGAVGTGRS